MMRIKTIVMVTICQLLASKDTILLFINPWKADSRAGEKGRVTFVRSLLNMLSSWDKLAESICRRKDGQKCEYLWRAKGWKNNISGCYGRMIVRKFNR